MLNLNITSETSKLEAVIIHEPGPEVENMTPATAKRALYSDILNLSIAGKEYGQFKGILEQICRVYEIKDLLHETLSIPEARNQIIRELADYTKDEKLILQLKSLTNVELCRQIIEGIPLIQQTLMNFLNKNRHHISPLHNIFFTRDSSFVIGNTVFISAMAKKIREPEAILMKTLFTYHPDFSCNNVIDLTDNLKGVNETLTIEGGDVLVLNDNTLIIGIGARTSAGGVDHFIREVIHCTSVKNILIQELPDDPESFIHLDMVFTLLNNNECMIYDPLILGENKYHTVLMEIDNKSVAKIEYVDNLLQGLRITGKEFYPVSCGGSKHMLQEREQWHSGANFLAFEHGKLIGYDRNVYTAQELNTAGYEVITAQEVIDKKKSYKDYEKVLITIEGAELSRGGGGARCMTMPVRRE
ncbi:MAG: arginine deiminase [Bacteroidales bacterium]|nr:arginine deiminase [Bacteroidales bacterium]